MERQIVEIDIRTWQPDSASAEWLTALEAGRGLYFPHLAFDTSETGRWLS